MNCWAGGGIIRSSVAMRYQLGFDRHAGSLMAPPSASTPHGTCESAMNWDVCASTSAANEAANLALSRKRNPSCGGRIGGTAAPGGGSLMRADTDSPAVGSKCGDVYEPGNFRVVAGLRDDHAPIRMAHQDYGAGLRRKNSLRDGDVVTQRYRWILDDADLVAVFLQDVVDALPTGTVHESAVNQHDGNGLCRRCCAHDALLDRSAPLTASRLRGANDRKTCCERLVAEGHVPGGFGLCAPTTWAAERRPYVARCVPLLGP